MRKEKNFYILLIFIAFLSCKQREREHSIQGDVSANTGQYPQFVLDNVFEKELHFPSEYRIMDLKGKLVPMKPLLNSSKIVIRLHESYCESCIIDQLQIINSSLQRPQDAIIGLATYSNIRKFRILIDKYKIEFPIYFVPYSDSFQLFSSMHEEDYLPFYFLMDTDLNSRYIFHPDLNSPNITTEYLKRCEVYLEEEKKLFYPLIIDNKALNINNASLNNIYNIEITYKSMVSENLVIDSINVDCGCLRVVSYDRLVKPMEQGKLILTYKPLDIGFDQKEIRIAMKDYKDVFVKFQAYTTD